MTELMTPVSPGGSVPVIVPVGTVTSVRELLTELAALEDATRTSSGKRGDRQAALARQQEIIDELHRRCPEGRADQPLL
jgi:hypothetical protein